MKTCSKCHKFKPLYEFYSNSKARDGRASWCKTCTDSKSRNETSIGEIVVFPVVDAHRPHVNMIWLERFFDAWSCGRCQNACPVSLLYGNQVVSASLIEALTLDKLRSFVRDCEITCELCSSGGSLRSRLASKNRTDNAIEVADVFLSIRDQKESCSESISTEELGVVVTSKRELLEQIKAAGCCGICGETDPVTFDFVHLDRGSKLAEVQTMARDRTDLTMFVSEIEKCAIICANCHRRVNAKQESTSNLTNISLRWIEKSS